MLPHTHAFLGPLREFVAAQKVHVKEYRAKMAEIPSHPGDCSGDLPYNHDPGQPGCVAPAVDPEWKRTWES